MTRWMVILLSVAFVIPLAGSRAARAQDDMDSLKKRFEERYATLVRLKDEGKVGETATGFAEVVEPRYASDKIEPGDADSKTVGAFVGDENTDRKKLYALIAEKTGASEAVVAARNARRVYDEAPSTHYFKQAGGKWVQKRDLEKSASR